MLVAPGNNHMSNFRYLVGVQSIIRKLQIPTNELLTKQSNAAKVSKEPFVATDQYTAATG